CEEQAPASQASAWSWPAAGIEEQGGIDGDGRRTLDAVGDPHPAGAAPAPQGVLRDARHRTHALRGGGDCGEARTEARDDEADDLSRGQAFLTEPMTAIPFPPTRPPRSQPTSTCCLG